MDERIKLLLDMGLSAETAKKVSAELEKVKTSAKGVADTYGVLERQVGEYEVLERRATQTTVVETTALDALGIQLQKNVGLYNVATNEMAAVGRAATTATGTSGRGGMGILGISYAVQDFTSQLGTQGLAGSLRAVQNNIPMVVTGLGMGMGLAGAVSIVSVGVGLLIDNWNSIQKLWGSGKTDEEIERMKKLAKATDDAREAAEKLSKVLPPFQQQAGKDVRRAVDAFGGPDVTKFLADAIVRARGDFGAENNRKMAQTLVANLLQGDRGAMEFMGELDLPGPIGRVLRGGRTPAEQQKFGADQAKQQAQELEAAKRHKEQLDAQKDAREKAAQDEANRVRKQMEDEKARDEDKRLGESQRLGRDIGRAFLQQQAAGRAANRAGPDELRRLPLIPENAGPEEVAAKTAETQMILNQSNREMLKGLQMANAANVEARRLLRQLQSQTQNGLGR